MNVTQDLSILHLIINASAVVQIVMAILAGVSVMSWYYIFMKWFAVRQARNKTEIFERDFWSGGDLNALYNSAVNDRHHVRRGDDELVTGVVEIACVDAIKMTPAPIPEFLHRKLEALQ